MSLEYVVGFEFRCQVQEIKSSKGGLNVREDCPEEIQLRSVSAFGLSIEMGYSEKKDVA